MLRWEGERRGIGRRDKKEGYQEGIGGKVGKEGERREKRGRDRRDERAG